jgi:hypothetical protein
LLTKTANNYPFRLAYQNHEDAVLLLETATNAAGNPADCKDAAKQIRTILPTLTGEVSNLVAAAKYDIEAAADAFDDEAFTGGFSTQYKAAKRHFRERALMPPGTTGN